MSEEQGGFISAMAEEMRGRFAQDLEAAWAKGKAEGAREGEFRGSKQGVIRVAMNLLRMGTDAATVARAAELPEPIIRKLAQDNGIVL